jgi:hypothetical protein
MNLPILPIELGEREFVRILPDQASQQPWPAAGVPMTVNRIRPSQHHEAEAVQGANAQKSPGASTKANAVDGQSSRAHSEPTSRSQPAEESQPTATADNDAGREQGKQQNAGNDTNGTRVNVFA